MNSMNNWDFIAHIEADPTTGPRETELARRLADALEELDRVVSTVNRVINALEGPPV